MWNICKYEFVSSCSLNLVETFRLMLIVRISFIRHCGFFRLCCYLIVESGISLHFTVYSHISPYQSVRISITRAFNSVYFFQSKGVFGLCGAHEAVIMAVTGLPDPHGPY